MKKIFVLTLILSLLLCACGQATEDTTSTPDTTVDDATSPTETEEIIYSMTPMGDYATPRSVEGLLTRSDFVAVAKVVSKNPTFVTAGYDPSDFAHLHAMEGEPQVNMMMAIRSSYTLELISVLKTDDTTIQNGDLLDMCAPGGVCMGYELKTEYPQLIPGEEYVIFLSHRNFIYEGEPSYTLVSRKESVLNLDTFTNTSRASTSATSIFDEFHDLKSLTDKISEIVIEQGQTAEGER